MARRLVAGVDSSTQSTKVELWDIDSGSMLSVARSPHPQVQPPVAEQDPQSWWDALANCFDQLAPFRADVIAINVAGQQHGFCVLDENGSVLRPAKLWNDTTSADQAAALVDQLGAEAWAAGCGSVPVASFTITKLRWLLDNEPSVAERVNKIMLPHDYLTWRLTGLHVTDRGDASGTGWFDPTTNDYRTDLLEAATGDADRWLETLPLLVPSDAAVGTLTADAAQALGLDESVIAGPGTGDNMAAATGLGLTEGDVVISLGTSGTVYAMSDTPTADTTGQVAGFAVGTSAFLPLVCTLNATQVTDTVAGWLGCETAEFAALAMEASATDPPVLIPYFDGERTPNLPDASGVFAGLRRHHTRADLARAAHDGVLCGLLAGRTALKDQGVDTSGRTMLIGGGAKSAAYRQRAADLLGKLVVIPDQSESVATGAAVQAAVCVDGLAPAEVSHRWNLGAGTEISPVASDGPSVRDAYGQWQSQTY